MSTLSGLISKLHVCVFYEPLTQRRLLVPRINSYNVHVRVCKSNESESVFVLCYELVFHHKWADAQFFMADAQFFAVGLL